MIEPLEPVRVEKLKSIEALGYNTYPTEYRYTDTIAEIVNIVAGGAKAKLSGDGPPMELSLPSVVRGTKVDIDFPSKSVWLEVSFESSLGPFYVRITLEEGAQLT